MSEPRCDRCEHLDQRRCMIDGKKYVGYFVDNGTAPNLCPRRQWEDQITIEPFYTRPNTSKAYILASAHWDYIEGVLQTHGEDKEVIRKVRYHYLSAFEHGWKHGRHSHE